MLLSRNEIVRFKRFVEQGNGVIDRFVFPGSGPRGAPRPSRVKIGRVSSVSGGYFQTS